MELLERNGEANLASGPIVSKDTKDGWYSWAFDSTWDNCPTSGDESDDRPYRAYFTGTLGRKLLNASQILILAKAKRAFHGKLVLIGKSGKAKLNLDKAHYFETRLKRGNIVDIRPAGELSNNDSNDDNDF